MNKIIQFDAIDKTVLCQGGVITEDLQTYATEQGLFYPVDFAARGSSHIAGNVATNAGGIKVIRYGLTRNWIAGLTVVTGSGEILHLNKGLVKNATGYDLRHLLIGSEGTLGIITEVLVKLTTPPIEPKVIVLGVPTLKDLMQVYQKFTTALEVNAFEFFTEVALKHVLKSTSLPRPFSTVSDFYLLLEIESTPDNILRMESAFESCLEEGWVVDGVVSQSPTQAKSFWRLREDISESVAKYKPYKNDISVRISKVPEFLFTLDKVLSEKYPHYEVVWFGHIGDGNLHINILKPEEEKMDYFLEQCRQVDQLLMKAIGDLEGSVSAEHGVGSIKKNYLSYTRSEAEINIMKQIKKIFDPDGILNPGKLLKD